MRPLLPAAALAALALAACQQPAPAAVEAEAAAPAEPAVAAALAKVGNNGLTGHRRDTTAAAFAAAPDAAALAPANTLGATQPGAFSSTLEVRPGFKP